MMRALMTTECPQYALRRILWPLWRDWMAGAWFFLHPDHSGVRTHPRVAVRVMTRSDCQAVVHADVMAMSRGLGGYAERA